MNKQLGIFFLVALLIASCVGKKADSNEAVNLNDPKALRLNIKNTVDIELYDQYARVFRTGKGTMISGNVMVAPLDLVQGSFSVKSKFLGREIEPMSSGYFNYDFNTNLVFLKISGAAQSYAPMASTFIGNSFYTLDLREGNIYKDAVSVVGEVISDSIRAFAVSKVKAAGTSLFNAQHQLVGVYSNVQIDGKDSLLVIPIQTILSLLPPKGTAVKGIANLRLKSNKIYTPAAKVAGFKVETTMGDFSFKVYDDLPEYKKNMIKLVSDAFYDSLLIHRVLYRFLIQMGAADTKYAQKGDPVGWKGPGYMLPTIIKPQYIHKRGAVALSKPPSYANPDNQTSGSQFYIIAGRTFSDDELNDYQKQKDFKYTADQRNTYKTVGGAAYLDRDYAVVGEIISGMDVIDAIASLPVGDDDRPLGDVRILKMSLIQ